MWLITLRSSQRQWVNQIVAQGRAISLFFVIAQFVQTAFHVYLQLGFHRANALTLLLLLWFGIYLVQSRHVRDSLNAPRWIRYDHHQRDDFSFITLSKTER